MIKLREIKKRDYKKIKIFFKKQIENYRQNKLD